MNILKQDFSKLSRELSGLESNNKETYDVPELFRKFNSSREAAEKILKEMKSFIGENNTKTEDKTT